MTPALWLTFLGAVVTGVVTLVSARTSAKAARKAAERTAELETVNMQLAARDNQVQSWRTDAEALREQRDAAQQTIEQMRKAAADQAHVIARLRRRLQSLIVWANRIVSDDALATKVPSPPIDLGDTDPNGWVRTGGGRQ